MTEPVAKFSRGASRSSPRARSSRRGACDRQVAECHATALIHNQLEHLSRKLKALGHDARRDAAKYVRLYSKGKKNDFRHAEAIAEAVQRPTMKFVATKTADQLDLQALHRVRERLVSQRTGIINQIRAFLLERGVAVRQGVRLDITTLGQAAWIANNGKMAAGRQHRRRARLAPGWAPPASRSHANGESSRNSMMMAAPPPRYAKKKIGRGRRGHDPARRSAATRQGIKSTIAPDRNLERAHVRRPPSCCRDQAVVDLDPVAPPATPAAPPTGSASRAREMRKHGYPGPHHAVAIRRSSILDPVRRPRQLQRRRQPARPPSIAGARSMVAILLVDSASKLFRRV